VLTRIKQSLEKLIEPMGNMFIKLGFKPNHITALGFLLGFAALVSLSATGSLITFLAVFTLASIMDVVDGYVARRTGRITSFGAFLDSTLDRAMDALTVIPLYIVGLVNTYEVFLLVIGEFLVSYARARGESLGVEMAGVGVAERAERLIVKFIIYFLVLLSCSYIAYISYWILVVLTYLTVLQRMLHAYHVLGEKH